MSPPHAYAHPVEYEYEHEAVHEHEHEHGEWIKMRAIDLPCCCPMHPRLAAGVASVVATGLYGTWSWLFWTMYKVASHTSPGTTSAGSFPSYLLCILFVGLTIVALAVMTGFAACFPHRDVIKHLSRTIWAAWVLSWFCGITGIVMYIAPSDTVVQSCSLWSSRAECSEWWARVQINTLVGVAVTLIFHFWYAIIVSSLTHTLHPHMFYFDDSPAEESDFEYPPDEKFLTDYDSAGDSEYDHNHLNMEQIAASTIIRRRARRGTSPGRTEDRRTMRTSRANLLQGAMYESDPEFSSEDSTSGEEDQARSRAIQLPRRGSRGGYSDGGLDGEELYDDPRMYSRRMSLAEQSISPPPRYPSDEYEVAEMPPRASMARENRRRSLSRSRSRSRSRARDEFLDEQNLLA